MKPAEEKTVCEEKVFREVHKGHSIALRNFLYYRFGDLEKASDYAQEAFIKLWKNCSKVTFGKAKSFLFTTANRMFLDYTDHQKVVLKFQKRSQQTDKQITSNPEYLYQEKEFKVNLEAAINNLPPKQRIVFLMSRIDKTPNKEIAETLDVSVKAVEKNITSALKNLKGQLDELEKFRI